MADIELIDSSAGGRDTLESFIPKLRNFLLSRLSGPSPGRFGIGTCALIARISSSRKCSSFLLLLDGFREGTLS